MSTFIPSRLGKIPDRITGRIRMVVVELARGGTVAAGTEDAAEIIARGDDEARLREIAADEAARIARDYRLQAEDWALETVQETGNDRGLSLAKLTDASRGEVAWCVRDSDGKWLSDLQRDPRLARELLEAKRAERIAYPASPVPPGGRG